MSIEVTPESLLSPVRRAIAELETKLKASEGVDATTRILELEESLRLLVARTRSCQRDGERVAEYMIQEAEMVLNARRAGGASPAR